MKLLIIIGDSAVGKMTVGQELCKITPFRLFHNHMAIEPVLEIFGSFYGPAIHRIREVIFEEFAKTEQYGLIFTYMWAFDMPSDWEYSACQGNLRPCGRRYILCRADRTTVCSFGA